MAKKITDLTALATAEADDYFAVYEDSSGITKKIKMSAVAAYADANLTIQQTLVDNSNGNPNVSDTLLVVDTTVTEDQWWAVYPTAGSPDETHTSNKTIWTALDSVPATADWIKVRVICDAGVGSSTTSFSLSVHARKNGDSESNASDNIIAWLKGQATAEVETVSGVAEVTIPVDSGCFDVFWAAVDATAQTVILALVGYGTNS